MILFDFLAGVMLMVGLVALLVIGLTVVRQDLEARREAESVEDFEAFLRDLGPDR